MVHQRRAATPETDPAGEQADHERRIRTLEERIERLETLLEGLQDSVHREAVRVAQDLEEIGRKIQPAETARALEKHAREHGL
jgi:flagellar motility protein MotE (MotC chaperone)